MFIKSKVITPFRTIRFIYHKPTKYFNSSYFLKQYPDKLFINWFKEKDTNKIVNKAADVLEMSRSDMFKMYYSNTNYEGIYIHPILTNHFLKWVSENEAHKYVLKKYLKEINKF